MGVGDPRRFRGRHSGSVGHEHITSSENEQKSRTQLGYKSSRYDRFWLPVPTHQQDYIIRKKSSSMPIRPHRESGGLICCAGGDLWTFHQLALKLHQMVSDSSCNALCGKLWCCLLVEYAVHTVPATNYVPRRVW